MTAFVPDVSNDAVVLPFHDEAARGDPMRAFQRSLIVVAAAALVAVGAVSAVWAQSDWKAPADAKAMKNPRADKKNDK